MGTLLNFQQSSVRPRSFSRFNHRIVRRRRLATDASERLRFSAQCDAREPAEDARAFFERKPAHVPRPLTGSPLPPTTTSDDDDERPRPNTAHRPANPPAPLAHSPRRSRPLRPRIDHPTAAPAPNAYTRHCPPLPVRRETSESAKTFARFSRIFEKKI